MIFRIFFAFVVDRTVAGIVQFFEISPVIVISVKQAQHQATNLEQDGRIIEDTITQEVEDQHGWDHQLSMPNGMLVLET